MIWIILAILCAWSGHPIWATFFIMIAVSDAFEKGKRHG
jgi:hypothetical protein